MPMAAVLADEEQCAADVLAARAAPEVKEGAIIPRMGAVEDSHLAAEAT